MGSREKFSRAKRTRDDIGHRVSFASDMCRDEGGGLCAVEAETYVAEEVTGDYGLGVTHLVTPCHRGGVVAVAREVAMGKGDASIFQGKDAK